MHAVADALHQVEAVAHQQQGPPRRQELLDAPQAAMGERLVAHGQHLVDQQHVRVGVDGDGEAQAHVHAGGVVLHRLLHEVPQAGELHDVGVAALDLLAGEPQHGAVDEDVLASRDLGVEAGAELDERRHPAGDDDPPRRRLEHAGHQLEHRRLARAVAADEAERLAAADGEVDAFQGGYGLVRPQPVGEVAAHHRALESAQPVARHRPAVELGDPLDGDDGTAGVSSLTRPPPASPADARKARPPATRPPG